MHRIIASLILASALFACASAQNKYKIADDLAAMIDTCQLVIKYSYSDLAGTDLGSGTANVQGNKYMVTEGHSVYISNGVTRWTLINDSREIYIENGGGSDDIFGNLRNLVSKVENLSFDGKNISFDLNFPGFSSKIRCKAVLDKLPFNPDAEFAVRDGVLQQPGWVVTDLR